MNIITLTAENISKEHICCAISDKKLSSGYAAKKEWLTSQFKEGYIFKKLDVSGKVFIEYVPAEKAWAPVHAPNYMLINCFWVSGQFKGQGYGKALFQECVNDSKDKDGIVVITAAKKQPYMSDKKFFAKQGFLLADTALPYFELWYKPLRENAAIPKFKDCCKKGECDTSKGIAVYYTNACPFTEYYVNEETKNAALEKGYPITIHKITTREQAQNHFVPFTIHSVFLNGKFVTQQILNKRLFETFV